MLEALTHTIYNDTRQFLAANNISDAVYKYLSKISSNLFVNLIISMRKCSCKVIRTRGDGLYDMQLLFLPNFLVKLR